jgi:hypothetical protein
MKLSSLALPDSATQRAQPFPLPTHRSRTPMTQKVAHVIVDTLTAAGVKHGYRIVVPRG